MDNKNQNTNFVYGSSDGLVVPDPMGVVPAPAPDNPEALSIDPATLEAEAPIPLPATPKRPLAIVRLIKRIDVLVVVVLVLTLAGLLITPKLHHSGKQQASQVGNIADQYSTVQVPLGRFVANEQSAVNLNTGSVVINGSLKVNDGLVVEPSVQPNAPTGGQLYYDQNTNQLAYYNGSGFVALTAQGVVVQNIGGATGAITLGGGLSVVGNQLTASFPQGVSSVGGQTGNVTLGSGLKMVGSGVVNDGVISLTPGTPNLVLANDGNGNLTISSVGGGSGTVTSTGGTANRIAKFTGVQNVEDSLLSDDGTTVTDSGNLSVTGSLALGTVLSVSNGGTGANNLPANGVVVGQGSGPLTGVTAASAGLCLVSTAGGPPVFQSCTGATGVSSLNGLTGGLTLANATGSVNTITINDASASSKGIASFNGTNFTVTGGAVNTAQNISTSATPTFAGVNTNAITPSSALLIGVSGQMLNLVGSASSTLAVTGGGQTTTIGFSGAPTGAVNYNFDRSAAAGTYTICTSAANCTGLGGGVTTTGGTTDRLSKFTGAQAIGDSSISDNGAVVTLNGTANLVVQGGTGTFGTLTQAGAVVLSDGSSNTVSIVAGPLSANRTYTLPDAGGNATLCVDSGNCIGGNGSAPNSADYLVATLNGTLTNERALAAGSNVMLTDGGANSTMTIATVQNPTFTTSVTTPALQSSGALTLTSAAGTTVAIDAGTTIELQNSTNVTGSLDVSVALTAGTANAFQVNGSGAIAAATGITSSGTIVFSGLNCTTFANGGALTTNASGQLACSDDDGGSVSAITGSGTAGTVPLFNGTSTITNSIITQSGTSVTVAGDLTLNTALTVANGGTGAASFTSHGLLFGNGTGAVQVTAAGTGGQVLIANATGAPTFATFTGDVAVSNTGLTTIQPDSVALGADTTGNFVATLGALTGLSASGNTGEGSTPTLSVSYGSAANTAVQGNVLLSCPSGSGNLTGGGNSVTLGTGGSCNTLNTVNNPIFTTSVTTPSVVLTGAGSNGMVQVASLAQGTVYTLPDPGAATTNICLSSGNCAAAGAAGGDLTGSYPNPTIAKLQGTNLAISGPAGGHVLVYNGTNGQWENHAVTGDVAISETGVTTIQANAVALGADTTGNYVVGLTAGNGVSVTGAAGEGWSPTVAVVYGSAANTAVQGSTSITLSAGTNLTGGGSITLGAGGTVTLNVASSPVFSGTLAVQGATATIGTATQQGSLVLNDGAAHAGTLQTATLGQNTTYTLPDPGAGTATICLTTGNCSGTGGGVTTAGGTTNRLSKFTGSQAIGDSSVSDNGSVVTVNGTANFVVQGGTATLGTLTQAGTLAVSDGSSNTVSIVAAGLAADHIYTLPDAGADATFCLSSGNCVGSGGGGAPNDAAYLVATLNGTLTNERALAAGSNVTVSDGGANGNLTVATVANPSFATSVTTPVLQSSGALTISSAAGTTVAIDAGTTIELQNSTNVTGSLDVSASFTSGTANAFQVNSSGAIAAATGITSSGTVTFSGLNCTTFANGGALTTNASGQLTCSDDDGGAAGTITGSGTSGAIPIFSSSNVLGNSIITQSGTSVTIAGDLTLSTALTVANGGTGAGSFTSHGVLFGNGTGALQVTAAGTGGQVLIANATGTPTFASFSGDVAVSNTGVTTIQANSVALGTDTTGNYVDSLGTLTGLSVTGNTGEGSTPALSVSYGSGVNTAVQGNVTFTCPSGAGNLTGGGNSVTEGAGGSCNSINIVNNPTFSTSVTTPLVTLTGAGSNGSVQVATLGQATTYTLPDPGQATASVCLSTGNCTAVGTASGDLTGSYPGPTIAKLQGGTLTITTPTTGNILEYNGSAWVNQSISGDIVLNSTAVATIQTGAVTSAKIADGTIANADLSTGSFGNITGVGTLGALTVVGTANVNTTGTAGTAIGTASGTFQLSSTGLNVSSTGGLTGVTGVTTSGGYTQSGTTANTLSGATSLTAAGTALSVTNNATVGGTLTVNTITPNSALLVGAPGQSFTVQGNATSTITATNGSFMTTVGFNTPTANTTISFPALAAGTSYTLCTSSGNCGGVGATLQTAYNFSTNPEIVLDSTRGALTVRDNATPLGANLLEVQNNAGTTTYFNVTASGINTTGTTTTSGNFNTTTGTVQTNSTDRITNAGMLTNITLGGATNASYLCLNSSNQVASCNATGAGVAFIQGGNSFNAAADLGTNDSNALNLRTAGTTRLTVGSAGGVTVSSGNNFAVAGGTVSQTLNGTTDGATFAATNTSGIQTNGLLFNRNGASGTTTNGINVTNTAGTLTNGLAFTGTIGTDIQRASGTLTIQGGSGVSMTTAAASGATGAITIQTGNSSTGTAGSVNIDAGTGGTANGTINIGATNSAAITIGTTSGSANTTVQAGGKVVLQAGAAGSSDTVQIGAGGAGGATPDFLALDVKSTTGDPTGGAEGYLYYNTFDNKFRCFQNTGWTDCVTAAGVTTVGAIDSQTKSSNGAVISGTSIYLQTADASSVGLVSTGAQTFAGTKIFSTGSSLTAFQVQSGGVDTFNVDTANNRVGIGAGVTSPAATLEVDGSGALLYATGSSNSAVSTGTNWLRSAKNTVTVFVGDNDSTSGYAATDSSADIRFNGTNTAWGDIGYYPQGASSNGQFIFSTAGSTINTTPNAKVGVGSLLAAGSNSVTLGTTGTATGSLLFKGSTAATGTLTVISPNNPTTNTLTLPNETGTLCSTGSVCAGYQASGSYANVALSNLSGVAINAALGFQSNQTANINFNSSAAAGNALNITGQTGTAGSGGAITIQGGTGTGGGNSGGLLTLKGGVAPGSGVDGGVTIDTGGGSGAHNGSILIGNTNAGTITIGNTSVAGSITNIQGGVGTSSGGVNIGTTTNSTVTIGSTGAAGNSVSIEAGSTNSIAIGNASTSHIILIGVNSSGSSANAITMGNNSNVTSSTTIQGGNGAAAIALTPYTTGGIVIGAAAGTGNITLGSSTAAQSVLIANGSGAATVSIANVSTAGNTVTIAGVATATGNTDTVNIATGSTAGTGAKVVHIADGTPAGTGSNTVSIGSTANSSATTVNGNTISLLTNSSSGSVSVKSQTNSATAFRVQDAANNVYVGADTIGEAITLGSGFDTTSWTTNANSLPTARGYTSTITANGYIYAIGGYNGTNSLASYAYAKLGTGGNTGGFTDVAVSAASGTFQASGRHSAGVVAANGYVYVIGGYQQTGTGSGPQSTVYYAKINNDGTLGSFSTTTSLPLTRYDMTTIYANGYIYVLKGLQTSGTTASVSYYANVNSDGTVGSWNTLTAQPNGVTGLYRGAGVSANGYIYFIGGYNSTTSASNIYYAQPSSTGDIASWSTAGAGTGAMPTGRDSMTAYVLNGYLYVAGGSTNGTIQTSVIYSKLGAGPSATWSTASFSIPAARYLSGDMGAVYNGYMYWVGGLDSTSTPQTAVYYTSTARVKVAGSLDLVGLEGNNVTDPGDGSSGSMGGSLTAGNTSVVGSLNVQGQASMNQGLVVNDGLSVTGVATFNNDALMNGGYFYWGSSDRTKQGRLAYGSGVDLQVSGGDMFLSGWSNSSFSGTQTVFLHGVATAAAPELIMGNGGSSTPVILVLDNKNDNATDPGYGTAGAMYYNTTSNSFRCDTGGTWVDCGGLLFANTAASSSIANTTAETNFSLNYTLPANFCSQGRVIRWTAGGRWSSTGSPSLQLRLKFGSVVLGEDGQHTTAGTTQQWYISATTICSSAPGATATVTTRGFAEIAGVVWPLDGGGAGNASTATVATNAAQTVQISAQWNAASSSNTVFEDEFIIESVGPD